MEVDKLNYTLVATQEFPFKRWAYFLDQCLVLHPRVDLDVLANLLANIDTLREDGLIELSAIQEICALQSYLSHRLHARHNLHCRGADLA